MQNSGKPVFISYHAREQLYYRGSTENEILETIRTSPWIPAELGRTQARKDFVFQKEWNGKFYSTKQVRPIFKEEGGQIVVITVYVYYF